MSSGGCWLEVRRPCVSSPRWAVPQDLKEMENPGPTGRVRATNHRWEIEAWERCPNSRAAFGYSIRLIASEKRGLGSEVDLTPVPRLLIGPEFSGPLSANERARSAIV